MNVRIPSDKTLIMCYENEIVSDIKNPTKVGVFILEYLLFQQNHLFCLPIVTRYNTVHVYTS